MGDTSIFTLENDDLAVKVNAFGAELCSVKSKQHALEYIWQAGKDTWQRHAPVLFPIVGRLKDNAYSYKGQRYPLGQHGFARDAVFNCVSHTHNILVFELKDNVQTRQLFPFEFSLRISYTLEKNQLVISYTVSNPASTALFFSIGAHPGFNCPLEPQEAFGNYHLEFPGKEHLTRSRLSDGLLTNETSAIPLKSHALDVSTALFDNDALVFTKGQVENIRLVSQRSGHGVSMHCKDWPYFGIWTKKSAEKFICLEPWHGIADHADAGGEIADKQGIIQLPPGENFCSDFSIRFF